MMKTSPSRRRLSLVKVRVAGEGEAMGILAEGDYGNEGSRREIGCYGDRSEERSSSLFV